MIHSRSPLCFLITVLCFSARVPTAHAQSPAVREGKSSSHIATAPADSAHVRFWKTELRGYPALRVTMTPVASSPKQHPAACDIGSGGPGYIFDNYADVPSGRGTLEIFGTPGATRPLVSLPAEFAPGAFITVLLKEPRKAGAPPQLEIIADGAEGLSDNSDAPAQFRVRSFVTTVKDVRVTLNDMLNAQFMGGDSYLEMRGLKPAIYPVKTTGKGTDGKPFEWTTETDLRQHHNQTLLIFPDPYGRIRPRMSVDGEILTAPAPATNDEGR